jgi:ketosteroid isomerase-like protein
MLDSDIVMLDKLLASELLFTNHLGQCMSKKDDLEAHRSGVLKLEQIKLSDQLLKIHNDLAIVSVRADISGRFAGEQSHSDFRFTRVWCKDSNNEWQVIAGHSSIIG